MYMLPKLTEKQNRFVLAYGNCRKPIEAFKLAYDCSNMNANTIYVEASRLMKNPKIAPWIAYIEESSQKVAIEELNYSIRDCFNEVDEMKKIALESLDKSGNPNINAAIKAVELKGKLAGHFDKDNKEQVSGTITVMGEVVIDGEELSFEVGENAQQEE